jgi:uncharacterized protein with PQ loop repeat
MNTLKNIFEVHATETGVFIVVFSLLLIIIQIITVDKSKKENSKFITLKSFFRDWFYLIIMLFYGLMLVVRNL